MRVLQCVCVIVCVYVCVGGGSRYVFEIVCIVVGSMVCVCVIVCVCVRVL